MVLVDYASSDDEGAGPSSSGISNLAITPSTKVIAAPDVSLEVEYSNPIYFPNSNNIS